jgi:hypothetical protein
MPSLMQINIPENSFAASYYALEPDESDLSHPIFVEITINEPRSSC